MAASQLEDTLKKLQSGEITLEQCLEKVNTAPAPAKKRITFKVTPKGCVGIYGLRRMPIVLYISELEQILEASKLPEFQEFLEHNGAALSRKPAPDDAHEK